ncbi:MAG TPA: ATP-binding protein [Anaerolineae bacterium]|nr:ATP-binding protein [Anaerolineae bacterium]
MPVDLSQVYDTLYKKALAEAKLRMERGDSMGAAAAYRQCAKALRDYAGYAASPAMRKERLDRAQSFQDLAARIESGKVRPKEPPRAEGEGPPGANPDDDYELQVTGLIFKSPVSWDDIGGLSDTKSEIKHAYGMSLAQKPEGVKLRGWRNLLFYGPPGTGKTLLAAATSNGLDATFFNVKVSDILSKYFGESSKLLSALFAMARKMSPAVVFVDEIESLSGQRDSGESGAERRLVSTFLSEMDGLAGKGSGNDQYVLTIAATNLPWLIDRAILSRFERKIYVPLPDAPAREAILNIHLTRNGHTSKVPMASLVKRTDGYSGREIERLCTQAVQHMVVEQNPSLAGEVDKGQEAVAKYRIRVRPLTESDLACAFEQIKPETRPQDLTRFSEWQQKNSG